MDVTAPEGLFLSLDALIKRNSLRGSNVEGELRALGQAGGRGGRGSRGGGGGQRTPGRGAGRGGPQSFANIPRGNGWGGDHNGGQGHGGQYGPQGGFQEALRPVMGIGKPHSRPLEHRVGVPVHSRGRQGGLGASGTSQRPTGRGGAGGKRSDPLAYKKDQKCYVDDTTGEVVVQFHQTDIVNISGDVKLTSGGFHTITTLHSLNDALGAINMLVTAAEEGPPATVEWAVRDGRSLFRFHDDMVLYAKGPQSQTRGAMVLQAFLHPEAAAATAASNAQAVSEGLLSAQVGGLARDRRSQPRHSGATNVDDSYYLEVGGHDQSPYSRADRDVTNGRVFSRLGSGGMMQMDIDDTDVRRMRQFQGR